MKWVVGSLYWIVSANDRGSRWTHPIVSWVWSGQTRGEAKLWICSNRYPSYHSFRNNTPTLKSQVAIGRSFAPPRFFAIAKFRTRMTNIFKVLNPCTPMRKHNAKIKSKKTRWVRRDVGFDWGGKIALNMRRRETCTARRTDNIGKLSRKLAYWASLLSYMSFQINKEKHTTFRPKIHPSDNKLAYFL